MVLAKDADTLWYPPTLDVFLNRWFKTYEEARCALESDGGYLFPYKHQFFLCEAPAVKAMGLDPDDPDWDKIGRDCARPADEQACRRLREKRERAAER
ncbi:MAG TPA: hypothetical protein VD861_06685 [Pyrinomonadaceae bacterium]|nr:hypothetical protein [Pyrinomonadaceae bacterium]